MKPVEAVELALAGGRVWRELKVPRTNLVARMRLVTRAEALQIKADVRRVLASFDMPVDLQALAQGAVLDEYNVEVAVRHLAVAVRQADIDAPLLDVEAWRNNCDDDQIAAMWHEYQGFAQSVDPLGAGLGSLSDADLAAIRAAAKKKDLTLLMSYGSRALAICLATSDAPPSS